MRVKNIVNNLPFTEKIKLVYERITLTPCTKSYFALALLHCITQVVLQSITFSSNKSTAATVHKVFDAADIQPTFAFVQDGILRVCDGIPLQGTNDPCWPIAGPGLQFNHSISAQLTSRDFSEENQDLFKRDDGEESDDDDDADSVASDDSDDLDIDDEKEEQQKGSQNSGTNKQNEGVKKDDQPKENAHKDDKEDHQQDDKDDDHEDEDEDDKDETTDETTQKQTDDLSGKLTNATIADFLVGIAAGNNTKLSTRCVRALSWPEIVLHDAKREDFVFLAFQIWLFGISIVTILNESIPHLFSALFTHGLSSGWSAFSVYRTRRYNDVYRSLIVDDACEGIDLLPNFWTNRLKVQISLLVFNFFVLACVIAVSFSLFKVFTSRTFKRVGASEKMNHFYKLVLIFSAFLQMSAFFTIASSGLWIDTICTSAIAHFADHKVAYKAIFIITCIFELPWLVTGWIAIRRESRILTMVFFILGLIITAAWASMFASVLYRWTFQNFPFFATMTITSFAFLISTLGLAVACRINFGKGLPQYLKTEDTFDFSSFVPVLLPRKSKDERTRSRLVSVVFPDRPPRGSLDEKYSDHYGREEGKGADVIDIKSGEIISLPQLERQLSSEPKDSAPLPPPPAARRSVFRNSLSKARQSFMTMMTTSTYIPQTPAPLPEDTRRFQIPEINIIPSSTRLSTLMTNDDAASYRTFGSQDSRVGSGRDNRVRSVGLPSNPRPNRQ